MKTYFMVHDEMELLEVGDRKMPVLPTAFSLLVSFQSGILFLGVSSEMYVKAPTLLGKEDEEHLSADE